MTGPEHYQDAERLLRVVDAMQERIADYLNAGGEPDALDLAHAEQAMTTAATAALAHAQLATAAATALQKVSDPDKWLDVAG